MQMYQKRSFRIHVAHFCNSGHSGNVTPCRGAGRICQYRLTPTMAAGVTDRLGESGDRVALVEAALYPTEPSSAGAAARALTEPTTIRSMPVTPRPRERRKRRLGCTFQRRA